MSDHLFEVPDSAYLIPPAPEKLTRAQRHRRLVQTRIATGEHPLGYPVMLHPTASRDPDDTTSGPRCGTCRFRVLVDYRERTYPKCFWPDPDRFPHPRESHSEASDIRAWWPACREYQPEDTQ